MGFDEFFGLLYHLNSYTQSERIGFDPRWEAGEPLGLVEAKKGENLTEVSPLNVSSLAYVDEQSMERALAYIKSQSSSADPFFCLRSLRPPHVYVRPKTEDGSLVSSITYAVS